MPHVHEQDEQPRAWIGSHRRRLADGVRLDPIGLGAVRSRLDELELLDRLRGVVFQDLEVVRGQVGDRPPVLRDVGIDAHEVGAPAERR